MRISNEQIHLIRQAYALGFLDNGIAVYAGVSVATVKRYRGQMGLKTNCKTALRGELGERLVAEEAGRRGHRVEWRRKASEKFDLYVNDLRVEVKTALQSEDSSWRFRLPTKRSSYFGQYEYSKDYGGDCEVIALVALYPDGRTPDYYLFPSKTVSQDVRIRLPSIYDASKNDWSLLDEERTIAA